MTTPGGVPNLPLGALTVETLAQQLQDMSATAMRQRAGQRFPDIFNSSTGGNVLRDLTPFGILTRIWSEINALIAASSPNDITGPEDLPPLLVDFIENLPFVGQFVQLLEALLGTYTGTDATLLAIQELFAPIRGLLQAILGIYEGDDPVLQGIEVLFGHLRTIVENFLNITGGNLDTLTDNIPIVGDLVDTLLGITTGTGTLDDLADWAKNLPSIPTLVSTLTGSDGTTTSLTLPTLSTWATNVLTRQTPIPADNLFGVLPPAAIPSIPVAHINTTAPNLLSQGSFNTPGTIAAADGWSWDDSQNRTQGGGGSAKITCNGTDRTLYSSQKIPVVPGDQIELSAAIRVSGFAGTSGSVNVAIVPFIGSTPQTAIVMAQANSANLTSAANGWVEIGTSSPVTINTGVTSIKVRLAVTSAATAGTVWFDAVQCSKAGLLPQGLVTDLPNAWNEIFKGAQGLDPTAIVNKGVSDLFGALSNPTSLAQTVTNNFALLQDILNTDPGQVLGTKPVDGGLPLGLGAALADGNLTFEEAFTVLGNAAAGTADTIGKALQGDFSGITGFFNNLLGVFGIADTAKNNSVTNADNIAETSKAVYNGYFGVGGSGTIAQVQDTIAAIKTQIFKGYTLETLTYNAGTGGAGTWTRPWTAGNAPKEFYIVAFGSGGGGGAGQAIRNNTDTYCAGGSGGSPGAYAAVEVDAATIPSTVTYQIAAGGPGQTGTTSASNPANSSFGTYLQTTSGQFYVSNLLGYFTSNQSAPGSGGGGGASSSSGGQYGANGGGTLLASGGSGGVGSGQLNGGTIFGGIERTPTAGSIGGTANLTGKSRSGGGGGGGGGGAFSGYETFFGVGWVTKGGGQLGGNGGFPGGGAGGGGASFTYDAQSNNVAAVPAGNGGIGGNGVIVLLWR